MSKPDHSTGHPTGARRYEIRLYGHLADRWTTWFDGLTLVRHEDGTTVISGAVVDQAALHGLLQRVRDTGLPLVSVEQSERTGGGPDPPHPDLTPP